MRCTARTWTRLPAKGSAEAKAGGGENRKAAGGNGQGETTDHAEYTDLEKGGDFYHRDTEARRGGYSGKRDFNHERRKKAGILNRRQWKQRGTLEDSKLGGAWSLVGVCL